MHFAGNRFCCFRAFISTGNFRKYEEWNQDLFDLILNQPSVQKLIDLSTSVIPNPMTVIGLDFTVIATGNQPDSQLKDGIFGSTEETQNVVNSLKQDSNYEEAQYRTGYFIIPETILHLRLCASISDVPENRIPPSDSPRRASTG